MLSQKHVHAPRSLWNHTGGVKIIILVHYSNLDLAMALPYSVINHIMGYFDRPVMDPTAIDTMVPFIGWSFVTIFVPSPAAAWFGRENDARIREMFAFHQHICQDMGRNSDLHSVSNRGLHS